MFIMQMMLRRERDWPCIFTGYGRKIMGYLRCLWIWIYHMSSYVLSHMRSCMILLSAQVIATPVHENGIANAYAMKLEAGGLLLSPRRLAPDSTLCRVTTIISKTSLRGLFWEFIKNKLIVSSGNYLWCSLLFWWGCLELYIINN